jgi:hypothetical protein
MDAKYYSLFCTQTQNYLHSCYNSRSLEELIENYRTYDWEMEKNLSDDEVLQVIKSNDYIIEDSLTPFDSLENDLDDEY